MVEVTAADAHYATIMPRSNRRPGRQLGDGDVEGGAEGDGDGDGEGEAGGVSVGFGESLAAGAKGGGPCGSGGAGGAASEITNRTTSTEKPAATDMAMVFARLAGQAPVLCAEFL